MKVSELIKILSTMPAAAPVFHIWDGEPRTEIEHVWLTPKGVMTADSNEMVYDPNNRPAGSREGRHWSTPQERV